MGQFPVAAGAGGAGRLVLGPWLVMALALASALLELVLVVLAGAVAALAAVALVLRKSYPPFGLPILFQLHFAYLFALVLHLDCLPVVVLVLGQLGRSPVARPPLAL